MVVGGGAVVDAVRHYDALRPGDPGAVHWLCVDLLETTFQLVRSWCDWSTVMSHQQLQQGLVTGFGQDRPTLVAIRSFYGRDVRDLPHSLPTDWQTTTDSLAALLTIIVGADELVLLKSCEIGLTNSLQQLSQRGVVDQAFPAIAMQIPTVRIEQL
jgi:aspartokinase-like uncharacterized kinase